MTTKTTTGSNALLTVNACAAYAFLCFVFFIGYIVEFLVLLENGTIFRRPFKLLDYFIGYLPFPRHTVVQSQTVYGSSAARSAPSRLMQWYFYTMLHNDDPVIDVLNWGFLPLDDSVEPIDLLTVETTTSQQKISLPTATSDTKWDLIKTMLMDYDPVIGYLHYHQLVSKVPTAIEGKHVLEVGCGSGGGAEYVMIPLFRPAHYTGLDLSDTHIKMLETKSKYAGTCATFVAGSAQSLPWSSPEFDVVVNLESAHCYPDFEGFVKEVRRVLRPGGYFAIADGCTRGQFLTIWKTLHATPGFTVCSFEDISQNVCKARNSIKYSKIFRLAPNCIKDFGCMPFSNLAAALECGELVYFRAVLIRDSGD